jgi:hypothetical protein
MGENRERHTGAAGRAGPRRLGGIRNAGLVVVWVVAVLCGGTGGGSLWDFRSLVVQTDLLTAVLRGATAWLALTLIWLAGIGLCERIIYGSGDQAIRRSGVQEDRSNTETPEHLNA